MAEQREIYKGREVILRTGGDASTARATAGIREDEAGAAGAELYIDGERIFTVRDAGEHILHPASPLTLNLRQLI